MADLKLAFNRTTKTATILTSAAALPAGSIAGGTFKHTDPLDVLGTPTSHNHAAWHHVRDLLYKLGELNMQAVKIVLGNGVTLAPT